MAIYQLFPKNEELGDNEIQVVGECGYCTEELTQFVREGEFAPTGFLYHDECFNILRGLEDMGDLDER